MFVLTMSTLSGCGELYLNGPLVQKLITSTNKPSQIDQLRVRRVSGKAHQFNLPDCGYLTVWGGVHFAQCGVGRYYVTT
jgi:hypothetical protein